MLRELGDPQICWDKFLKHEDKEDGPVDKDDCEDECAADVPSAPLAEVKTQSSMAGRDYLLL